MKQQTSRILYFLLFLLVLVYILYVWSTTRIHLHPHVCDIWVINLEKDTERWQNIESQITNFRPLVHRWPATNGKLLTREEIHKEGVGYAMTRTGDIQLDSKGEMRNRGVVGCWLSHKRLLTHLASLDVPGTHGHLVVEDDVMFPTDFLETTDEWHKVYTHIPTDWDIVYLGLSSPIGSVVANRVLRGRTPTPGETGNWGTHAYIVKHSSLQSKILPQLTFMTDAIDEQYSTLFDAWNVYIVEPSIIALHDRFSKNSSLLRLNVNGSESTTFRY